MPHFLYNRSTIIRFRSRQDRVPAVAREPGHLSEIVRDNRELLWVGGGSCAPRAASFLHHGCLPVQHGPGRAYGRVPLLRLLDASRFMNKARR